MMRVFKYVCASVALLLAAGTARAQKVTFEANAPAVVSTDEIFRIEFALNAKPDQFSAPDFPGFEVVAGPSLSNGQSISIVNGQMASTVNYTYTYVLQGREPGMYTIPAAGVTVDGKSYHTKPLPIEVLAADPSRGQVPAAGGQASPQGQQTQQAPKISNDDIFLRAIVDRTTVYKGQPIRVAFKLYTSFPLGGAGEDKTPAFNGFWTQQLNTGDGGLKRENYNNRIYDAAMVAEYLLFPQQAGTLTIEQYSLTVIAQIVTQMRRQSLFDDFFGGGSTVQNVRKIIKSNPIQITVKELPAGAPASFQGAVGKFTLESGVSAGTVSANSSASYTVKLSGSGNLPLIPAPKLPLPTSFEQYNIKTTENLSSSGGGIVGYRQFEYPFIVRAEGSYAIEPVEFSYFNPELVQYVTLRGKPIEMTVMPDSTSLASVSRGIVSGMSKEEIKILGEDIRFIKLGSAGLTLNDCVFMGSWFYCVLLFCMLAGFAGALIYLRKRIRESRNTAFVRGKRANKVALQRLKTAEKYMKEDDRRGFYDELLRALWGYIGDKLNIPAANLTKENVREELLRRNVSPAHAARLVDLISECEYAQYSPAVSGRMQELYQGSVEVISRFETVLKR